MIVGGVTAIRLNERRLQANVADAVVGDVPLKLTMEGASELTLTVSDPDGRLRRSRFMTEATRITIGEHTFALAKTAKQGSDVNLVAEDLVIHKLRRKKGPKKAFREKVTRAQFIRSLVKEVDSDIRFICPELTKEQPVKGGEQKPSTKVTKKREDEERAGGISRNATGLTVKGEKANSTQKKVADEIIRAALKYDPPRRALISLLCAATVESVMGTAGMVTPVDHDSLGILQARLMYVARKDALSIPYNVRRFFKEAWTGTPHGGAIRQANAGRSIGEICTSIQGNAGGDVYSEWQGEAERWLAAYNGGDGPYSVSTTVEKTQILPYAFEVKKGEDYWTAIKRLAGEVGWRVFAAGGRFYYIAEPTLFRSRRRINIGAGSRGVDDIDFDLDGRKKVATATLTARADLWKAPPGTVVNLTDYWGPARGRWLVATIDGALSREDVSIELKRPSKPKPEPANQTKTTRSTTTRDVPGASSGRGGADKAVNWAKKVVGVREGSSKYNAWMAKVGGANPWCGYFIAYMMKYVCGFRYLPLDNGAHSSSWLSWSKADRVSLSSLRPGDILVYNWNGDGETDHVALYIGGGRRIGGNESDQVMNSPADLGRCVGAVRPRYR